MTEEEAMRAGYRNAISDIVELIDKLKARLAKHGLREEQLAVSELQRCGDMAWALRDKKPFAPIQFVSPVPAPSSPS